MKKKNIINSSSSCFNWLGFLVCQSWIKKKYDGCYFFFLVYV